MKITLKKIMGAALMSLAVVACNPTKMAKNANLVTSECNPQVLEAVAGQIHATYSLNFPEKYFLPKAIMEVKPVLVYQGGEAVGETFTLQGEKITENNTSVPYQAGAKVSRNVVFKYVSGMEKAHLELRVTVFNKTKTKSYKYPEAIKIADGTNTTYMLVKTKGDVAYERDNYQKVIKESKEAQILYTIDNATVRRSQLTSQEIKDFKAFLEKTENDPRRTITSNDIVAYASPDGPETLNANLSVKRGKTAEKAFSKTINKNKKKVVTSAPVNVKNISEDWEGFQELVSKSNIEDKDLILRVLSMYSDPAVREKEIKNMSSVYKTLAKKVLPELRRARFIANINYKNYTNTELKEMVKNGNIENLDEEALLYAAKIEKDKNVKASLYKKAASKFNSSRASENLAALYLTENKISEAKKALSAVSEKNDIYYNNLGVAEMKSGKLEEASAAFAKSNLRQARYNQGAIEVLHGNYTKALSDLSGAQSFNEALANILVKNENKAAKILGKAACPCKSYLKAIIAARAGDSAAVKANLKIASKEKRLADRQKNDIEFAKIK
jgi:tetratricopeptide (TPR) repeat protein